MRPEKNHLWMEQLHRPDLLPPLHHQAGPPKKTKVVCEDGTEFFTKETVFLTPVHEMNIENERANLFQKMGKIITALDRASCRSYIGSYEEMKEAADHLAAFYDFCMRNSQEG